MRSDREEAVLPRPSRARWPTAFGMLGLRSALLVLPELGDVAGAARSGGRVDARRRHAARAGRRRDAPWRARCRLHLQRAAHHRGVGRRDLQGGARRRTDDRVRLERQRHGARAAISSGRGSICTRSISRASTTSTTGSSAAASSRSSFTIRRLHEMGVWLEIVTLLIPGFNDAPDELKRLTSFLASVSPDIPWHVTAFHKDYRMSDPENTTPEMLMARRGDRARGTACATSMPAISRAASAISRTRGATTARRCWSSGMAIWCGAITLPPEGACPKCGTSIPGRWGTAVRRADYRHARSCRAPGAYAPESRHLRPRLASFILTGAPP